MALVPPIPSPTPIPPAKPLPPNTKVVPLVVPFEVNIVGSFVWNPSISDAEMITVLTEGSRDHWAPDTDDFSAAVSSNTKVKPTVNVASTFGEMLGAIWKQPIGKITRVNVFTHANPDVISFSGTITRVPNAKSTVMLNVNGQGDNLTAMDATGMNNLNQPGVNFQTGQGAQTKNISIADIRQRFAPNAVIVLYACHSGLITTFIKSIATFFQVKVIGFTSEITYFAPNQTIPNKFQRNPMLIGFAAPGVVDWRGLISDPKAVTATP